MTSSLKKVVCGTALALVSSFCLAQNTVADLVSSITPKPLPKSPEVAALGKFGDYSVNLYTGLPEISIPLYEVKSGSLTVPITLSYHASGIRYTQQATWVGLGWSLSAGGGISREVRGKRDEEGFLGSPLKQQISTCTDYWYLRNATEGASDLEADMYSYSFAGKTGKFFYRAVVGGGIETVFSPYIPLVVTKNNEQFDIKDTDGLQYRFGTDGPNLGIEYTSAGPTSASTAWHLMKMSSPNSNDVISFQYQSIGLALMDDISWRQVVHDQCDASGSDAFCPSPSIELPTYSYNNSSVSQKALQTITFEGGKVDFVSGPSGARLDQPNSRYLEQVVVYANVKGVYTPIKYITFIYNYFKNSAGNLNLRLKLDGIDIKDANQVTIQKYRFEYFTNNFSWDTNLYSTRRDYWDYFNGATNNTNLIPVQTIEYQEVIAVSPSTTTVGGAIDRQPNPTYSKEGVLKKITFPTGGSTEFDFENHKYFENGAIKLAGGLRIKSIISNDSKGGTTKKTYRYGLNECDYGEKNFHLSLFSFVNQIANRNVIDARPDNTVFTRNRVFLSNPAVNLDAAEGSPVVYNYVSEIWGDNIENIGKVVFQYDSGNYEPDIIQFVQTSTKHYRDSNAWKRGKLSKKTVYDKVGQVMSVSENYYKIYQSSVKQCGIGTAKKVIYSGNYHSCCFLLGCDDGFGSLVDQMEYKFQPFTQTIGTKLMVGTKERMYEQGSSTRFVDKLTAYIRDPVFLEVTETRQSSSEPTKMLVTRMRFPFSYTYSGSETGTAKAMRLLKEQNALSTPIEQLSLVQHQDGTNIRILAGSISEYTENPANLTQVVPRGYFFLESESPIPIGSFTNSSVSGNTLLKHANYRERLTTKFDQNGNVVEISKSDDNTVAYLWGYEGRLPVAEVVGSLAKNVFHTSFEDLTTGFSVLAKSGSQSRTSGFLHTINGLDNGQYFLSYFSYNGTTWVHNLTEHTVTSGAFTISLTATSTAPIDEVRFYPKGALIKTFCYKVLHGMSTATDENALSTYFLYDSFGRLHAVKDDKGNILKTHQYNYVNVN